ncbi:hypothetical protein HK097_005087 [Rhizophlyctis rosea]|uniref:Uncharacterized protein n=1 Tax=Rhizophlyctis rosea TaxID=64517 RepID=A0AAD5SK09_9FUNG|nr:hypothetical protein HK097_005087 [Rhizophlyctis rosea]
MPRILEHLAADQPEPKQRANTSNYVDRDEHFHKALHATSGAPGSEAIGSDHHKAQHGHHRKSQADAKIAADDQREVDKKFQAKAQSAALQ